MPCIKFFAMLELKYQLSVHHSSTRAKMNNLINVVNNLLQCCSQQLATMLCCILSTIVVNKHCSRLLEQLLFTVDESTRCEQCCWNSSEQRDNSIVKRLTNQQGLNNIVGTAQINLISFQFYIVNNSEHYCFNNVDKTPCSGAFFRGEKNI